MIRFVSAMALAVALLPALWATEGEAAAISRETLERRLLDTCVYRQFSVKDIDRNRMIENCRCATKSAMGGLEGAEFQQPRSGGLTGPQDQALKAGIAACFKPK